MVYFLPSLFREKMYKQPTGRYPKRQKRAAEKMPKQGEEPC